MSPEINYQAFGKKPVGLSKLRNRGFFGRKSLVGLILVVALGYGMTYLLGGSQWAGYGDFAGGLFQFVLIAGVLYAGIRSVVKSQDRLRLFAADNGFIFADLSKGTSIGADAVSIRSNIIDSKKRSVTEAVKAPFILEGNYNRYKFRVFLAEIKGVNLRGYNSFGVIELEVPGGPEKSQIYYFNDAKPVVSAESNDSVSLFVDEARRRGHYDIELAGNKVILIRSGGLFFNEKGMREVFELIQAAQAIKA